MEKKCVFYYESPELEVIELDHEGVLCGSNEIIDENEGVW